MKIASKHNTDKDKIRNYIYGALLVFIMSFLLHAPPPISSPMLYTDYFVFWNRQLAYRIKAGHVGLPYADIFFEYPPVPALIFFIATLIPDILFGFQGPQSLALYFMIISIFILLAYIGSIYEIHRLLVMLNRSLERVWQYMILAPSLLFFMVYNWDIIAVFFTLLSIRSYIEQRFTWSALWMGFAIASKLIPVVVALAVILELIYQHDVKGVFKFIGIILFVYIGLNLPFMVINFDGWFYMFVFLSEMHIEDSWILYLFLNPQSQYAKYVTVVSFMLLFLYLSLIHI